MYALVVLDVWFHSDLTKIDKNASSVSSFQLKKFLYSIWDSEIFGENLISLFHTICLFLKHILLFDLAKFPIAIFLLL